MILVTVVRTPCKSLCPGATKADDERIRLIYNLPFRRLGSVFRVEASLPHLAEESRPLQHKCALALYSSFECVECNFRL